jgi:hypothetical protein
MPLGGHFVWNGTGWRGGDMGPARWSVFSGFGSNCCLIISTGAGSAFNDFDSMSALYISSLLASTVCMWTGAGR